MCLSCQGVSSNSSTCAAHTDTLALFVNFLLLSYIGTDSEIPFYLILCSEYVLFVHKDLPDACLLLT